MRILFYSCIVLMGCVGVASAQAPQWSQITFHNGAFSVSLPERYLVHKDDDWKQINITSHADGSAYTVSARKTPSARQSMAIFRKNTSKKPAHMSQWVVGRFAVEAYNFSKASYHLQLIIASPDAYYSISVWAREPQDPTVAKFLASISAEGKPLIADKSVEPPNVGETVSAEKLETSPVIVAALGRKQSKKIATSSRDTLPDEPELDKFYTRPLMILTKPRPGYTDLARYNGVQGTVVLKVEFRGDGDIATIAVADGLGGGLSDEAVAAAKKIKFLPAEINGKPVDVIKKVEYSFTIY